MHVSIQAQSFCHLGNIRFFRCRIDTPTSLAARGIDCQRKICLIHYYSISFLNIIGGPSKNTQKNRHDCKEETIYEQIGIVQLKEIHKDYRTNYQKYAVY